MKRTLKIKKFMGFSNIEPQSKYFGFSNPKQKKFCWGGGMPMTDPYIIRITNSGAAPVANVVILDAANRIQFAGAGDSFGNPAEIHLAAGSPNVQYQQILQEIMHQPFTADMVQIQGAGADITQPLSVTYMNAKGVQETKPIITVYDPYQTITTAVRNAQRFKVDGFTRITIPMISGNSTTMIYIYPLETNLMFVGRKKRMFVGENPCRECERCPYKLRYETSLNENPVLVNTAARRFRPPARRRPRPFNFE